MAASMLTAPRAIALPPRAEANPAEVINQLATGFTDFKAHWNSRLSVIEAAVDKGFSSAAYVGLELGAGDGGVIDPEYRDLFASYMRGGDGEASLRKANAEGYRAQIRAAMSGGSAADGGYLAPVEWDRHIYQRQREVSPLRRLATVVATGTVGFLDAVE